MFPKPVAARCIRINPRAWQGHISMRFDVLGCPLSTAGNKYNFGERFRLNYILSV